MKTTHSNDQELSRRQALKLGTYAVTAAALLGCRDETTTSADENAESQPAEDDPKANSLTGFIDCHSHVWPSDTVRYPLGEWASKEDMSPAEFTAEDLLKVARPNGVDRAVLIQHAPYYGYDAAYLIDCAKRYPGVFSIVGMIDERQPKLEQRLTELRKQGVRGIRIGPTKHADRTPIAEPMRWLEAAGMRELWKLAAAHKIAICPLLDAEFLPTLKPMIEQNPETVCVIDHFAHIDPAKPETLNTLLKLAEHVNVYVKVSAFYKFGDKVAPYEDVEPWIQPVYDAFGPDRLMWGSDCPYQLQNNNNYADSVALIRDQLDFLSSSDRVAILRDTAERVFWQP